MKRASFSGKTAVGVFLGVTLTVLVVFGIATWDALNNELDRLRAGSTETPPASTPASE